jgi:catechol 2,3-dioxygenase-like lactoylglutathione lyase family enzyme
VLNPPKITGVSGDLKTGRRSNPSLSPTSAHKIIFMDKIHHIAIQVESIAKSVDWYKENFDITVSYQDETWAMIDFENTSLALVIPEQHPFHFAIESKDAESFGQLTEHRDGTASVYIKDIDGNNVEMIKLPEDE